MGLLDRVREVLGTRAAADAGRDADPEDLFGMSTAYVTMAADLGFPSAGAAALCFGNVDSTDFDDALVEVRDILGAGARDTGTEAALRTDDKGYRWVVLRDDDPEDLVTSVHFAADTLVERGYGNRLLAAVFAFEREEEGGWEFEHDDPDEGRWAEDPEAGERAYWVYSFRRGAYYPFAPRPGRERDSGLEFKLRSVLDGELAVEADERYWYPMWPDSEGGHPWE